MTHQARQGPSSTRTSGQKSGLRPEPRPASEISKQELTRRALPGRAPAGLRRNPRGGKGALRATLRADPCHPGEPGVGTSPPCRGDPAHTPDHGNRPGRGSNRRQGTSNDKRNPVTINQAPGYPRHSKQPSLDGRSETAKSRDRAEYVQWSRYPTPRTHPFALIKAGSDRRPASHS